MCVECGCGKRDLNGKDNLNQNTINMLADTLYCYINKDLDNPHGFEKDTIEEVAKFLLNNYSDEKYSKDFFKIVLKEMKEV